MSDPFGLGPVDAGGPDDTTVGGSAPWRAGEYARGLLALAQAGMPSYLRWLAWFGAPALWLRAWRVGRSLPRGATQRYDFLDEGIAVDAPTSARTHAWTGVQRVVETPHFLLVFPAAERGRFAMPWRVFAHLERGEVRSALRRLAVGARLDLAGMPATERASGPGGRRTQARTQARRLDR